MGLTSCLLATMAGAVMVQAQTQYGSSPPVYPSPETLGLTWEAAYAQAQAFTNSLTLEEKAMIVTGTPGPCTGNIAPIERLGFKGLCLQDGPLAIRQASFASVFPAGLTTAASWDKSMMYTRGMYLGSEFKGKGAHIALGPVAGPLGRNALGGRNWEGFSPDPYLTGIAMEETITGMQDMGVQSCAKHYIANEQETQRNPSVSANGTVIQSVSSNLDDRTMHELYNWPFANAVRSGVSSVMCSYNRVNGSYACQNSKVLNGILKTELGFQGYVMSDWEGTHTGVSSIEAGLDMNMPGGIEFLTDATSYFGGNVTSAVNNGTVQLARVNDMVTRIMTPYFHLGQTSYPGVDPSSAPLTFFPPPYRHNFTYGTPFVDVRANHGEFIRELGAAGMVLLKNTNNALPLKAPKTLGVFGNDAPSPSDGLSGSVTSSTFGFEYGNLAVGGGSGTGRLTYLVTPLDALIAQAAADKTSLSYILNNDVIAGPTYAESFGIRFPAGISTVIPTPEVCLVFLKTYATEGVDRVSLLADWNSTIVVENVASICNNTIVITNSGGLNTMPWADNPNVTAIVAAHLSGQESGNSVVDVLYGKVNPSGHLPYTIAKQESDYSYAQITNSTALLETNDPDAWTSDFTEGVLIDYRHFDYYNVSVQYEFGYGLSYTTFGMSGLQVNSASKTLSAVPTGSVVPGGHSDLWDTVYTVNMTVTNTGSVAGSAVPQLYVSLPAVASVGPMPVKQLRGFEKISLQPGESKAVGFDLMRRDISYWDAVKQAWVIPQGSIGLSAGFSSRDIKLTGSVTGATS